MTALLSVRNLHVGYRRNGRVIDVLKGVDFQLEKGESLGIVGESGCGKSTTSVAIMGLLKNKGLMPTDGEIVWEDDNLLKKSAKDLRKIRGKDISMIFQEPMTALNPLITVGKQITEQIKAHEKISKTEAAQKAINMLRLVGIPSPEARMNVYPHEMSGGMRQRVMIAMALSCRPKLLIADEPTTALDVTIQAQILELLKSLRGKFSMSMILITHDLGVVANNCHRVLVMYDGKVMEEAGKDQLFRKPLHPYSQGLLHSVTSMEDESDRLYAIPGHVPLPGDKIKGCVFQDRCPFADEKCRMEEPPIMDAEGTRKVRCWKFREFTEGVS